MKTWEVEFEATTSVEIQAETEDEAIVKARLHLDPDVDWDFSWIEEVKNEN